MSRLEAQLADTPVEPLRGYAPACAGGAAGGSAITLAAGEERTAVDLHLQRIELGWIEGIVVLPEGVNPREVNMLLFRSDEAMPGIVNSHVGVDDNGRFVRDGLVPGAYRLEARTRPMDGRVMPGGPAARRDSPRTPPVPGLWASADLVVDSAGTAGVVLELQPAAAISGEVVFERSSPRPPDLTRLQVMASPIMPSSGVFRPTMAEMAQARADSSGRFTLSGVFPGSYRLAANLPGWYLKSAMLGDRELLDFPLDVKAGHVTGVTLTLTDRIPELSATVVDAKGQPAMEHSLVLFPADDRYWTTGSRRVRVARAMPDGTFTFRGVPAGEYRVAALLDFDQGELGSREFLQQLAWSSTRVTLADGETRRVSLRVQGD